MTGGGESIVLTPGGGKRITLTDRGARVTLKAVGEDTGGRFSLVESAPAPGAPGLPPHRHRHSDEGLYVTEGELAVRVGERTVVAPAGTFIFIPRGTVHAFSNPGPRPAKVLIIFSPAGLEKYLEETAEACSAAGGLPDPRTLEAIRKKHDTELVGPPRT